MKLFSIQIRLGSTK